MNEKVETLNIEGMTCQHCIKAVREALANTKGVEVHYVEIGSARVSYDPDQTGREEIVEAVEEEGYEVR